MSQNEIVKNDIPWYLKDFKPPANVKKKGHLQHFEPPSNADRNGHRWTLSIPCFPVEMHKTQGTWETQEMGFPPKIENENPPHCGRLTFFCKAAERAHLGKALSASAENADKCAHRRVPSECPVQQLSIDRTTAIFDA